MYGKKKTGTADSMERASASTKAAYKKKLTEMSKKMGQAQISSKYAQKAAAQKKKSAVPVAPRKKK